MRYRVDIDGPGQDGGHWTANIYDMDRDCCRSTVGRGRLRDLLAAVSHHILVLAGPRA